MERNSPRRREAKGADELVWLAQCLNMETPVSKSPSLSRSRGESRRRAATFHLVLGLLALSCTSLPAFAQGQPVTREKRDAGFTLRELVEGQATALGGVPLITISGTPGAVYQLFGSAGLMLQQADTATPVAGVRGALTSPALLLSPALFAPTSGTFGVIPASGRQDLNLAFPLPAGLAPLVFDLQVLMQQTPGGPLDFSDAQMRQVLPAAPPAFGWTQGNNYPPPPPPTQLDWADIEQGDVDGDGDNDTVGGGATLELWLTTLNQNTLGMDHVFVPGMFPGTANATSVELSDLNNDGFLDVAATFLANRYLRIWQNNGLAADGVWRGFTEVPAANIPLIVPSLFVHPADLETGDVDGDGFRDIMMACASNPVVGEQNRLFINRTGASGMGIAFKDETALKLPVIRDDSEDCEFVDFDLDGDLDVVIANVDGDQSIFGTGVDYILVNQGFLQGGPLGTFLAPLPNPVPAINDESLDVSVGDIDRDGRPDLYYANWALSNPSGSFSNTPVRDRLYLNRIVGGQATFVDFSFLLPDAAANRQFSTDSEIVDVDFDGDLDIVVGLGTLGPAAPIILPAVPNLSLGVQVIQNPGMLVNFPRLPIPQAATFDIRDLEHGDWRESPGVIGPFGLYFDKDFGIATTVTVGGGGAGPILTTLDHL